MNTSNLKPFRLEEFKSNEETPVVHAEGYRAWIVFPSNWKELDRPVVAIFTNGNTCRYSKTGHSAFPDEARLFFTPRKKVVPLSLEDIKPGMAFRLQAEDIRRFPSAAGPQGLSFASFGFFTYTELRDDCLYSFDCLTWHRCEKEVDA